MKKYDELLKRAEIFEKLAVYGNRNTFLKAIAQPFPRPGQLSATPLGSISPFDLSDPRLAGPVNTETQSRMPNGESLSTQTAPDTSAPVPAELVAKLKAYQKTWNNYENYFDSPNVYNQVLNLLNAASNAKSLKEAESNLETALNRMTPELNYLKQSETHNSFGPVGNSLLNEVKETALAPASDPNFNLQEFMDKQRKSRLGPFATAPASPKTTTPAAPVVQKNYEDSPEVRAIQKKLFDGGYFGEFDKVDGKLGQVTKAALRKKYPGKTDDEAFRLAFQEVSKNDLGF